MTRPRIIYNNLWRKGTAMVSTPTADPQHPVSDTQIDTLSMFWKSSNKATTPTYIPMNLGAGAGAIDFVAILAHNIDADATITLEHDDASNFPSPTSIPITYNATNIFQFFTAFTEQWVRLKLVRGGGFTVEPQVATILCGSYLELNRSERPGYERGHEDPSEVEEGDELVIFTQEKPRIEIGSFPFEGINDVTQAGIMSFIEEVGIHKAFVLCFDYTDANNESVWVRNSEISHPRWQGVPNCWAWELRTREIF